MDTRRKIITREQAQARASEKPARWVAGNFDPLLAEHVRRLGRQIVPGQLLVVEVTNPAKPLLPQQARAELVAGLAMVDYVVLQSGAATAETACDLDVTEHFIEHVLGRHRAEGAG